MPKELTAKQRMFVAALRNEAINWGDDFKKRADSAEAELESL